MAKITAVIDIGSNSARIAIFEKTSHFGFHLLYESKSKVRISENSYKYEGYLQEEAMERAIEALKDFLWIAKLHKARKILCVATSAVRDAPNKAIFLQKARAIGLKIKVIDGQKESYFGALAALNLLPYDNGITIDIGGGSTECALIQNGSIVQMHSLDIGTIRLKELFFDRGDCKGAYEFVSQHLQSLSFKHPIIFGIGGSTRAISKAIQKNISYPLDGLHAFEYDFSAQRDFIQKIYQSPQDALYKFGIKEDRIDSIQGGSLILYLALEHFGAKKIVTSGVGVREGVFLDDLLRKQGKFPPNFNPSVRSIKDRFIQDVKSAKNAKWISSRLFSSQESIHLIPAVFRMHLDIAAELSNTGIILDFYEKNLHSNYIVFNALNYGFTHKDRLLIAFLTRYNNKKFPSEISYKTLLPPVEILQILCFFVTLASLLSYNPNSRNFLFSWLKKGESYTFCIQHENFSYLLKERLKKISIPSNITLELC